MANDVSKLTIGSTTYDLKDANALHSLTTTGSGNAVTSITASNGAVTATKGSTFLTSHQDISGKADKASITAGTAGTSSATSGSTLAVPYVTMNAQGIVTGYGTHTHTVSGFSTTDTKNTAGTTSKTATKMFLVGATSQAANPQTYSNANCYIGTDNALYSEGKKVLTTSQSGGLRWVTLATNIDADDWEDNKANWQPYSAYSQYEYLVFLVRKGGNNSSAFQLLWLKTSSIPDDSILRLSWQENAMPSSTTVSTYWCTIGWDLSVVGGHTHGGNFVDSSSYNYVATVQLKAGTPTFSRSTLTYRGCIDRIFGVTSI